MRGADAQREAVGRNVEHTAGHSVQYVSHGGLVLFVNLPASHFFECRWKRNRVVRLQSHPHKLNVSLQVGSSNQMVSNITHCFSPLEPLVPCTHRCPNTSRRHTMLLGRRSEQGLAEASSVPGSGEESEERSGVACLLAREWGSQKWRLPKSGNHRPPGRPRGSGFQTRPGNPSRCPGRWGEWSAVGGRGWGSRAVRHKKK